jgi:hypothetical protein
MGEVTVRRWKHAAIRGVARESSSPTVRRRTDLVADLFEK